MALLVRFSLHKKSTRRLSISLILILLYARTPSRRKRLLPCSRASRRRPRAIVFTMYSYREYYEMVRSYILSGESLNGAQRLYRQIIPRLRNQGIINPSVPNRETILAVISGYETMANSLLLHTLKDVPGRDLQSKLKIFDLFERSPRSSTRDAAQRFGVSQYAAWKLLHIAGLRRARRLAAPVT